MERDHRGADTETSSETAKAAPDTTLELLHNARGGDEVAMNRLYERLLPAARRWVHGRLPRAARRVMDTEDVVQETLGATLSHIKSFEPDRDGALYYYVRRALRNRLNDEYRRAGRKKGNETLPEELEEQAPGPLEAALGRETLDLYEAALEELKPEERAMVVGRIEFGLRWSEIAEIAGKSSEDAARVAVSRALTRIARKLGDGGR